MEDAISAAVDDFYSALTVGDSWPESFWRKRAHQHATTQHWREKTASDFNEIGAGNDPGWHEWNRRNSVAGPELAVLAREALSACLRLPTQYQRIIFLRCDNASLSEISDELGIDILAVLDKLKKARHLIGSGFV